MASIRKTIWRIFSIASMITKSTGWMTSCLGTGCHLRSRSRTWLDDQAKIATVTTEWLLAFHDYVTSLLPLDGASLVYWAMDGGYTGEKLRAALKGYGDGSIEIIKRSETTKGFQVLPRSWFVERTFGWFGRCRRLEKEWETSIASSTAWLNIASIRVMIRRLSTYCYVE